MGFIDKYIPVIGKSIEEADKNYPGPKLFTSLHSHSIYSQLDGVASPEDYFEGCAHFNMPAFAITDHGTMANLPDSYLSAKKNKIKNISGCEFYLNDYHALVEDKKSSGIVIAQIKQDEPELWERYRRNRHLTVLAKNMIGYRNMIHMNGEAWEKFFYYKPRTNMKLLEKYKDGLIVVSGCFNGPLSYELRLMLQAREEGNNQKAEEYYKNAIKIVKGFYDIFGDDYYLEFQMHGDSLPYGNEIFAETYKIHLATGIRGVICLDCLSGNTKVLTKTRGYIDICQLKIDEEVMTHMDRYKKVVAIMSRPTTKDDTLYSWFESDIIATGNHKMLVARDGKVSKIKLSDMTPNDMLCVKPLELSKEGLKSIKINDYIKCRVGNDGIIKLKGKKVQQIPNELMLTDDALWLIGYYIAEGYGDSGRLSFACHQKETHFRDKVVNYFKQFGHNPAYLTEGDWLGKGAITRICCRAYTHLFKELCGHKAKNKHLPPFWAQLSKAQLMTLIKGYLDGDGSFRLNKLRENTVNIRYSTISVRLQLELVKAFSCFNIAVAQHYKKSGICSFKRKNGKLKGQIVESITNPVYSGTIKRYGVYLLGLIDSPGTSQPYEMVDGYLIIKNKFIKTDQKIDRVYDIEVEDDHTFNIGFEVSNCHYYAKEDHVLQKTMFAVEQKTVVSDPDLFYTDSKECYFKTRSQLRQTFHEYKYYDIMPIEKFEEFCDNTVEISQKCETFAPDLSPKLPNIPNSDEELTRRVIQGLKNRGEWDNPKKYYCDSMMVTHREQATLELRRIIEKGFSSYFLITQDILDYSRSLNFQTGPGRGSSSGSIIAYALGIVDVNALKFGLSFDRFLSPSRGGYMLNIKMD